MSLRVALTAFWMLCAPAALFAETLRVAVTTSFANSGLADILLPEIATDTGIDVQLLIVGTGQALKLGQQGDVDAVLVHARAAEEAFVAAGHATHRTEIMHNDFVLIGPLADTAGLASVESASSAFQAIAQTQSLFVSRGDDSGTHKTEMRLWGAAGLVPEGAWYRSVGQGMGPALNTASGMGAIILTDRASWLNFGNKADLAILFEGDPALFNQYAFLPVNPAQHGHVNGDGAVRLEAWLTSPQAEALINGYRLDGAQLFAFNAAR